VVAPHGGLNLVNGKDLGQRHAHDDLGPTVASGIVLQRRLEANSCGKRVPHKLAELPELSLGAVSH
jgi:hypothetical protein